MSKQQKRSKKKVVVTSLIVIVGLALLTVGGILGLQAYQKHQENKIYSVGESMNYPDFSVEVTKVETKTVDLPLNKELVQKYGLDVKENCEALSKTPSITTIDGERLPYGPSDYHLCNRRNSSREEIKKYLEENKQFVIDYRIIASNAVDTSKVNTSLIPDSGRTLSERANQFNSNEFIKESIIEFGDGTRIPSVEDFNYIPYFQSDIGQNIGKGLERTGYLYADVRNTENSIDFILSYEKDGKTHTRTMRVNLHSN